MEIKIENLDIVVNRLQRLNKQFSRKKSLFDVISRRANYFLKGEAPVVTGKFKSTFRLLGYSEDWMTIGSRDGIIPYRNRVIFGLKRDGTPFSHRGFHIFDRNINAVKQIAMDETEQYINRIVLNSGL